MTLVGSVYVPRFTADGSVRLELVEAPLGELEIINGELVGPDVSVESRSVLVGVDHHGEPCGTPMTPIVAVAGRLAFDPSAGGVRTRENRLARGAFNRDVAEAARFGMVNVFFHLAATAHHVNRLLGELGAPRLPPVHAVVGAHSGSRLPGYGRDDADYRHGERHPLQGAHYRLSSRTRGIPEPVPVRPEGEIHFGPGRHREAFAGRAGYLRNAAHNPPTIFHEYGHHLCRHTADFRLNDERAPAAQRNGKTGPEEGVCDFLAAVRLGTGRPYGWYRPGRGAQRDPGVERPPAASDADPHALGARWSTVFWRTRQTLLARGLVGCGDDHDRALLQALLTVGNVAGESQHGLRRRVRAAQRAAPATTALCYLEAIREAAGSRAEGIAEQQLVAGGLLASTGPEAAAC